MWHQMASEILVIIGSGNDSSPVVSQAIIWTIADSLSIRPQNKKLQWNLNENITILLKKMH